MNTVERAILRKVQNHKYFFKVNETLRVSKFSDITLIYMPVNAQVFRKFLALQYVFTKFLIFGLDGLLSRLIWIT